jgi:hypothetical protein
MLARKEHDRLRPCCGMIVDMTNRHMGLVRITAQQPGGDEPVEFLQLADESARPSETEIRQMLSQVSLKKSLQVYGMNLRYSLAPGGAPDPARFPRNTLVEVALPYCLHLPNGLNLAVSVPEANCGAIVVLQKFWTSAAAGSATADLFTTDHVTYAAPVTLNTPNFPEDPELGPRAGCSGTNIEIDRDINGQFRYSKLKIFFDTQHHRLASVSETEIIAARDEAVGLALKIVNRIIDVYRYVTKEDFVQRLGSIHVTDLYFAHHDVGIQGASFGGGIRDAIMNRTKREIEEIAATLKVQSELPLADLLFLDAQAALSSERYVLAVIHAFQALEVFLEEFLYRRFAAKGMAADAIERIVAPRRTKERLKEVLSQATGHSLTEDRELWDRFCLVYDQVRNKLIHAAKEIDQQRSRQAVEVSLAVQAWLNDLK